jgi:hypothetical protein
MNDLQLSAVEYYQSLNAVWFVMAFLGTALLACLTKFMWRRHYEYRNMLYGEASVLLGLGTAVSAVVAVACIAELYAIKCGPAYFAAKCLAAIAS